MSLLVTGSIAIDTVKTPFGVSEECLGGSAVYFAMAASALGPVRLLGVVGDDFPFDLADFFRGCDVDLTGLEVRAGSKTFRWAGSYQGSMNEASTDGVELNVLAEAPAKMPGVYKNSDYVFLANTHPAQQMQLLEQLEGPKLIVADTMNLWIENEPDALRTLLKKVDGLVLNDGEVRMLTGKDNLVAAAKEIVNMGLQFVVVKKGEHGAMLLTKGVQCFVLPAYPTDSVKDPTGAGDSFAGGMMGYLAGQNGDAEDFDQLKNAVAHGAAVASLVIEDFSLNRWKHAGRADIDNRLDELKAMVRF